MLSIYLSLSILRSARNSLSSESKFTKFLMLRRLLKLVEVREKNAAGLGAILSGIKDQLDDINPAFKGNKMQVGLFFSSSLSHSLT